MPEYKDILLVAKNRMGDPLNTWPDHISCHRRTIMGAMLHDYVCLRCVLEQVSADMIKEDQMRKEDEE